MRSQNENHVYAAIYIYIYIYIYVHTSGAVVVQVPVTLLGFKGSQKHNPRFCSCVFRPPLSCDTSPRSCCQRANLRDRPADCGSSPKWPMCGLGSETERLFPKSMQSTTCGQISIIQAEKKRNPGIPGELM